MPRIFINGQPIDAKDGDTVMQAAAANGIEIPCFCWHPALSIAGNCRVCVVQPEGNEWTEIACNMPAEEGLRVLTDSDLVREHRKATLQFLTLNHPVDCGICDKAGECTLQDYHYALNGAPSQSVDPKVRATKFHPLSPRVVIDNERCILCSRCVRFTNEISGSHALGIKHRGDASLVRAVEDGSFERDPYSDNVIDICPVGALLSPAFLYKARVWYLEPTPSVCPGCARGCAVQIWHRKPEWRVHALDERHNLTIARVTPLENPAVNGPWICNKARDLAKIFERPRAQEPLIAGKPAASDAALDAARRLLDAALHPVALVSSWGSNEELDAFKAALGDRVTAFVKQDCAPAPDEVIEDAILIRADKNPNTAHARALFGAAAPAFAPGTDLVLVWGEGFDAERLPAGARVVRLGSYVDPSNARADVFIPVSIQTERSGHYTNFQGVVSAFEACFPKRPAVLDAEAVFAALAQEAKALA